MGRETAVWDGARSPGVGRLLSTVDEEHGSRKDLKNAWDRR